VVTDRALFISLEGIEGAGKSTHMPFIAGLLARAGREVVVTREPGGTPLGEQIRRQLLLPGTAAIGAETELLLMFAARRQHLDDIIRPALAAGKTVLCDRFTDSSFAYQGGGRGIAADRIARLADWVHPDLKPHLTLLLDVPVALGLSRTNRRNRSDRFESETADFFEKVRLAYLDIAKSEPDRVKVIDASAAMNEVQAAIANLLKEQGVC